MKLTPEDFARLETKELANIIRKLSAGKTLTKREEEKLARAKEEQDPANAEASARSNFAATWDELARILSQRLGVSVTRKSLQNWRNEKMFPELAGKWPRPRPDGRHDVAAWMKFMFETGRHRADEILEDDEGSDDDRKSVRDWKIYREELHCREAERRIARGDSLLLVATELEIPIGSMLAAINSKLQLFPPRAARFMIMKRDAADAEQTLRDEMDAILKDLNLAGYIDAPIDDVVNEFPFNDETAALYQKVSFSGQDRAAFLDLIRTSVNEVLRRIGQRALSAASDGTPQEGHPGEVSSAPDEQPRKDPAPDPTTPASSEGEAQPASRKPRTVTRRGKRAAKRPKR